MTRKRIYETIADAYYCEPEDRTEEQRQVAYSGICRAYDVVENGYPTMIGATLLEDQRWFVSFNDKEYSDDFFLPSASPDVDSGEHLRIYDLIRADFCTLMSLLTNKEYEEISR